MTSLAFALILASAGIHAAWNLLAKRLPGGAEPVWLFTLVAVVVYAPLALTTITITGFRPDGTAWLFLLGTGLLQTLYFTLLRRGYATGDLSVVYPLARGTGPLMATLLAVILIGERPSTATITGAAIVCLGAYSLIRPGRFGHDSSIAVIYGVATGVVIGVYTAWDGYAVSELAIPALVYDWVGRVGLLTWLTPVAWRRLAPIGSIWSTHRREVIGIGILSSGSYVMILFAMTLAPISSIAPAREISIVIGTLLGVLVLGESEGRRRILSAVVITIGVGLVAIA